MQDQATPKGHPPGLSVAFGTELWERFCFYGMRALLVLYLTKQLAFPDAEASEIYGSYQSLVYATNVLGGLLADRFLGFRAAIVFGGLLMAAGEFLLMVQDHRAFFLGLSLLVMGCGFLKPNISALLGKAYTQGDPRRDSGFTIFYMGINLGAFLGPIVCARFADPRFGFAAAGVGMLLAVAWFALGAHRFGDQGHAPAHVPRKFRLPVAVLTSAVVVPLVWVLLSDKEWRGWIQTVLNGLGATLAAYLLFAGAKEGMVHLGRMVALLLLLALNAVFWACFEQAGNSMNLFAERNVALGDFGFTMKAADTQAFNALFIILLAPLFAALWLRLDRRGWNPWVPVKFALGIVQVGLGFGVLVLASKYLGSNGIVPLWTLALCYLIHTTGELCISPVGLSTMTRLAPARLSGLVMGGWFLSTAYGNFLAGQISKLAGRSGDVNTGDLPAVQSLPVYADVFWMLTQVGVFIGLGALVLSPLVQRLMKDVK